MPTALLKTLIVLLFFAVLASLSSALFFLFKDTQDDRKRLLYALGVRITLAAALLSLVFYGLHTGQLSLAAPWHGR
jgi:4-hydroxybenzoate polyprenyltransferase